MNFFPNVFLFKEKTTDKYKRKKIIFENYKGTQATIIPTPEFDGMYLPKMNIPQLILPSIKLGLTSQVLRVEYKEKSSFQQFWKGYPRKKLASSSAKISEKQREVSENKVPVLEEGIKIANTSSSGATV